MDLQESKCLWNIFVAWLSFENKCVIWKYFDSDLKAFFLDIFKELPWVYGIYFPVPLDWIENVFERPWIFSIPNATPSELFQYDYIFIDALIDIVAVFDSVLSCMPFNSLRPSDAYMRQ